MVAAFSKIFLRSHHLWTFMIHIFIIGASWKVIVIVGIRIWDIFIMSEEIFLLGSSSYLYFAHWVLGLNHSLPFIRPRTAHVFGQGPRPNTWSGPLTLKLFWNIWSFIFRITYLNIKKIITNYQIYYHIEILFYFILFFFMNNARDTNFLQKILQTIDMVSGYW